MSSFTVFQVFLNFSSGLSANYSIQTLHIYSLGISQISHLVYFKVFMNILYHILYTIVILVIKKITGILALVDLDTSQVDLLN